MEYVLVIEDSDPHNPIPLSSDLAKTSERVAKDISLSNEIDEIQGGLTKLTQLCFDELDLNLNESQRALVETIEPKCQLYVCALCQKRFPNRSSLENHPQDQLHVEALVRTVNMFSCRICPKTLFTLPTLLFHHVKNYHQTENHFQKLLVKLSFVQMYHPNLPALMKKIQTLGNGVLLPTDVFSQNSLTQNKKSNVNGAYSIGDAKRFKLGKKFTSKLGVQGSTSAAATAGVNAKVTVATNQKAPPVARAASPPAKRVLQTTRPSIPPPTSSSQKRYHFNKIRLCNPSSEPSQLEVEQETAKIKIADFAKMLSTKPNELIFESNSSVPEAEKKKLDRDELIDDMLKSYKPVHADYVLVDEVETTYFSRY